MEALPGDELSTKLQDPDPVAVLEAACCSEILLQLGDLAALTKRASTVFRELDEQETKLRARVASAKSRSAKLTTKVPNLEDAFGELQAFVTMVLQTSLQASPSQDTGPEIQTDLDAALESIGNDLDASEAQHREVQRLMSFSNRLADLAGSTPTELQQLQALEAHSAPDMGTIPEATGVEELENDGIASAPTALPQAVTAEVEAEPSEDDASAQLAALERELELELQPAGNSVASLRSASAIPSSATGSHTAAAHETATSSSETNLQASVAGMEPDANSIAAANPARAWPLSAALARHRWRALLSRRTKTLPSGSTQPAAIADADAAIADDPPGTIIAAGLEAAGDESTSLAAPAAVEAAASLGQPGDTDKPMASAQLSADAMGHDLQDYHVMASRTAQPAADTIGNPLQVDFVNGPAGAALTTQAATESSEHAGGSLVPAPVSIPTADDEQPATVAGSEQAVKRKFSFRNSLKEAVAVPAVLRQMRKDRLKQRDTSAQAARLMQATSYTALEAAPVSPDKPLGSIQESDTEADEEATQASLLGSHMTSAPLLSTPVAATSQSHTNPIDCSSAPQLNSLAAADAQPDLAVDVLTSPAFSTPVKGSSTLPFTTSAAAVSQQNADAAALTRQDLITPMKGATAADLADDSASENPETWLMGASSIGGTANSQDALSVPPSPLANAVPADHDMMQFSPSTMDPDTPFAAAPAGAQRPIGEAVVTKDSGITHAHGDTCDTAPAGISRLPSVRDRIALLDKHVPLTGQHHSQRQRSPERLASPMSLRVITENIDEEMLIGAHHGEQERSPKKSSAAQLLVTDESKEVVLVGSHHLSRQPPSLFRQHQQAIDVQTQELVLLGTHHAEPQRSPASPMPPVAGLGFKDGDIADRTANEAFPGPDQSDSLMENTNEPAPAITAMPADGSLLHLQPAAPATEQDALPHDLVDKHQEDTPYQAALVGPAGSSMLVGQNHGKRQKWPRKAPKWLQRVVSLSRPGSPISTGVDAPTATSDSQSPGAGDQLDGQDEAIASAGDLAVSGELNATVSELLDDSIIRELGSPEDQVAPISHVPVQDEAVVAELATASVYAVQEYPEPESSQSETFDAPDASMSQVPSARGSKAQKRGQRGSRLLQKVLSGLSGKTSPRKHTSAAQPDDLQSDARHTATEGPVIELPLQPDSLPSAKPQPGPGVILDSYAAEAPLPQQLGGGAADKPAAAGPAGVRGSIESMDSLQMEDLLADTPFKGQAPGQAFALPQSFLAPGTFQAELAKSLLDTGNSDAQHSSRKTSPSLNTSRRTQHPVAAVSPFLALSDDNPAAEIIGHPEQRLTMDELPDVPRAAVLGGSGVGQTVPASVRRPVAEGSEDPSRVQQTQAFVHSQTMQPEALAAWFPHAKRISDTSEAPPHCSSAAASTQVGGSSGKMSGWLAPMARLGRATSFLRGGSDRTEAAIAAPRSQILQGANVQRSILEQNDMSPLTSGDVQPSKEQHILQQDGLPTQLSNWTGPLIRARHAAPVAPPLPPGSVTMQQEYAAGCAALLDGMSSFDSSPEQSRTSLLNASPLQPKAKLRDAIGAAPLLPILQAMPMGPSPHSPEKRAIGQASPGVQLMSPGYDLSAKSVATQLQPALQLPMAGSSDLPTLSVGQQPQHLSQQLPTSMKSSAPGQATSEGGQPLDNGTALTIADSPALSVGFAAHSAPHQQGPHQMSSVNRNVETAAGHAKASRVSGDGSATLRPPSRAPELGSAPLKSSSRASGSGTAALRPPSRSSSTGSRGPAPRVFHAPTGSTLDGFSPLSSSMNFSQGFSQDLPEVTSDTEASQLHLDQGLPPQANAGSEAQQPRMDMAEVRSGRYEMSTGYPSVGMAKPGHHRRGSSISNYSPLQMSIMQLPPPKDQSASQKFSATHGNTLAPTSDPGLSEESGAVALVGDNHSASQKQVKAVHQRQKQSSGQEPALDHPTAQQESYVQQHSASARRAESYHKPQLSFTYSPLMAQAPNESLSFNPGSLAPVPEASETNPRQILERHQRSAATAATAGSGAADAVNSRPIASHHATHSSIYAPLGKARHSRTPSWTHAPLTQISEAALKGNSDPPRSSSHPADAATHQEDHTLGHDRLANPLAPLQAPAKGASVADQHGTMPSQTVPISASLAVPVQSSDQHQPTPQSMIRHSHAPSSVYGPLGKAVRSSRILAEDSPRRHFDAAILGSLEDPFPRRQAPAVCDPNAASAGPNQPDQQPQPLHGQGNISQTRGPLQVASHASNDIGQSDSQSRAAGQLPGYVRDHTFQGEAPNVMAKKQPRIAGQGQLTAGGADQAGHGSAGDSRMLPNAQQVGSERWWAGSVMSDAMLSPLAQGFGAASARGHTPTAQTQPAPLEPFHAAPGAVISSSTAAANPIPADSTMSAAPPVLFLGPSHTPPQAGPLSSGPLSTNALLPLEASLKQLPDRPLPQATSHAARSFANEQGMLMHDTQEWQQGAQEQAGQHVFGAGQLRSSRPTNADVFTKASSELHQHTARPGQGITDPQSQAGAVTSAVGFSQNAVAQAAMTSPAAIGLPVVRPGPIGSPVALPGSAHPGSWGMHDSAPAQLPAASHVEYPETNGFSHAGATAQHDNAGLRGSGDVMPAAQPNQKLTLLQPVGLGDMQERPATYYGQENAGRMSNVAMAGRATPTQKPHHCSAGVSASATSFASAASFASAQSGLEETWDDQEADSSYAPGPSLHEHASAAGPPDSLGQQEEAGSPHAHFQLANAAMDASKPVSQDQEANGLNAAGVTGHQNFSAMASLASSRIVREGTVGQLASSALEMPPLPAPSVSNITTGAQPQLGSMKAAVADGTQQRGDRGPAQKLVPCKTQQAAHPPQLPFAASDTPQVYPSPEAHLPSALTAEQHLGDQPMWATSEASAGAAVLPDHMESKVPVTGRDDIEGHESPDRPSQPQPQAHWSPFPQPSSFRTPLDALPHHSFGNPFNDPGLASERGTIKSTYTSDTMRTNMTVDTLPSIARGNPKRRPKLESHLADLRYLAAHQRNDTKTMCLAEHQEPALNRTEHGNGSEGSNRGHEAGPHAGMLVSPARRQPSESHRYGLDVSIDAVPWEATGHHARSQRGSGVPSPQSEAESLEGGHRHSMNSEDSDISIPGLQQSHSPRAAHESLGPGSPDEESGGSSSLPWPGEDMGALGTESQDPGRWLLKGHIGPAEQEAGLMELGPSKARSSPLQDGVTLLPTAMYAAEAPTPSFDPFDGPQRMLPSGAPQA
ncbi:hypothetical protein WJX74_000666 [Apatococcus lobatus]|uniref:Uncharacterized protein n=1 Tax=Apatococcus lobatus TaxID=904363 RepID=A0AAW1REE4_9CHLO